MNDKLSASELVGLVKRVFAPTEDDRRLAILVDLPDAEVPDTPEWKQRREMAADWARLLASNADEIGLDAVLLFLYGNPHANNANLPATATWFKGEILPATAEEMTGDRMPFDTVFETTQIFIAPTQFSATAPLKMAAPQYGFRAATMPGFSPSMIPALRIDYAEVNARVDNLKKMLDRATRCHIAFDAQGDRRELTLDLRHRTAHASGGLFLQPGTAGNLPSGESYIVPYEGEKKDDPSQSNGALPVQIGDDIVVYRIEQNRAVEVTSQNQASEIEAKKLEEEPAYGNVAELGLGVLGDFGLEPTGQILLDEKLGLHIAFGRSEHFGGQVGPEAFSDPSKVVHLDRVYIESLQPKITVAKAELTMESGDQVLLMKDGEYQIDFNE